MTALISKEIHLKHRPEVLPDSTNFALVEEELPDIEDGQVLVRNIYMSVDPYMRARMDDVESYLPPFDLNRPLEGDAIGQVLDSRIDKFKKGDFIENFKGWREYFMSDDSGLRKIETGIAPLTAFLGVLGMTGLTAYAGLIEVGRPDPGETVFVSAASGAVGSVVCQIAKIYGCRVVGSAGSDEKVAWLIEEAGIDDAINYKSIEDLDAEVGKRCPEGIDIYFENVGGRHLQAALVNMNDFGRIVLCGFISQYNSSKTESVSPLFIDCMIDKRLRFEAFLVTDYERLRSIFFADMQKWISTGKVNWKETIVEGIENAPSAFFDLFKGKNFGKMIVKI